MKQLQDILKESLFNKHITSIGNNEYPLFWIDDFDCPALCVGVNTKKAFTTLFNKIKDSLYGNEPQKFNEICNAVITNLPKFPENYFLFIYDDKFGFKPYDLISLEDDYNVIKVDNAFDPEKFSLEYMEKLKEEIKHKI